MEIVYKGDRVLREQIDRLGLRKTLPEIKAYLMRVVWSMPQCPPDRIVDEVVGEDGARLKDSEVFPSFRDQLLALLRQTKTPFHFTRFEASTSAGEMVGRIQCRVGEILMLLPLFAEITKPCPEVLPLKETVIRSLELLNHVLDALLQGELPPDFTHAESDLDRIDALLETAFDRLGELCSHRIASTHTYDSKNGLAPSHRR